MPTAFVKWHLSGDITCTSGYEETFVDYWTTFHSHASCNHVWLWRISPKSKIGASRASRGGGAREKFIYYRIYNFND